MNNTLHSPTFPNTVSLHCFSEAGPRREHNQDNYYFSHTFNRDSRDSADGRCLLSTEHLQAVAVFDGMGGESCGEQASLTAAEALDALNLPEGPVSAKEASALLTSYYASFMQGMEKLHLDITVISGTTCVGILLSREIVLPFWIGDSRAYLFRAGKLTQLTRDHSLGQMKIDMGLETEETSRESRDWHVLTQYMGNPDSGFYLADELHPEPGDRILLCSDGITDGWTNPKLEKLLVRDASSVIAPLQDYAVREAHDNSTVILLDF